MSGRLIMVVDDSAMIRKTMSSALTMNGYRVEAAGDGLEAMGLIKGGTKPDLIITDIHMPNMDGIEFIRQARANASTRFTPMLALTTEGSQARRDEARALGATGWLIKPVSGAALLGVVRQVLPE